MCSWLVMLYDIIFRPSYFELVKLVTIKLTVKRKNHWHYHQMKKFNRLKCRYHDIICVQIAQTYTPEFVRSLFLASCERKNNYSWTSGTSFWISNYNFHKLPVSITTSFYYGRPKKCAATLRITLLYAKVSCKYVNQPFDYLITLPAMQRPNIWRHFH